MNIKIAPIFMIAFISSCSYAICNNSQKEALIHSKACNGEEPVCITFTNDINDGFLTHKDYQLTIQGWSNDTQKIGYSMIIPLDTTDSMYLCPNEKFTVSYATDKMEHNIDHNNKNENAINFCGVFHTYYRSQEYNMTISSISGRYINDDNYMDKMLYKYNGITLLGNFEGFKYPAVCTPTSHA